MLASIKSSMQACQFQDIMVTDDDVIQAIASLTNGKSDSLDLYSEHLKYACPIIVEDLSIFFTACFRHGFLPQCIRDCVIVPVLKSGKDSSCSQSYRPITLASTLSKVIEHVILLKYGNLLHSSHLQFGFKAGASTTLCTALMRSVVSRYINNGSKVLGCFLDASKAFDRVDHGLLFQKLEKRGFPPVILNFLLHWYCTQRMSVRWTHNCLSRSFTVSNGVRQGSVLSPFLFAVYLDSLLNELSLSGVGCCWRWMFAGVFCFADDIVLLAPCASALRKMLSICSSYASSHGLTFNTEKTQLICFRKNVHEFANDYIELNGTPLKFSDKVLHLGHLLSFDMSDNDDVLRVTKDVNRKANSVRYTFRHANPFVKTFLFKMYCLSLYGCVLWSLSSPSIRRLQVAINKILRKIWNLPRYSHTSIVLNTARISFVHSIIMHRYSKFISRCLESECLFVKIIISDAVNLAYSSIGYNYLYGHTHIRLFNDYDHQTANTIRFYRHRYGINSPYENYISCISS